MLPNLNGYFILSFWQGRGPAEIHKCLPTEALMDGTWIKEEWSQITTAGAAKYSEIKGRKAFHPGRQDDRGTRSKSGA